MFKATPNPPDVDPIPYDPALDPQKIKEATDRAIKFYLNPVTQIEQNLPHRPHRGRRNTTGRSLRITSRRQRHGA